MTDFTSRDKRPGAGMTRREMLKGAVTVAVAGTGLMAMDLSAAVTGVAPKRVLPAKWDETYDVVIVGSGFAGLAAAAEAAGKGAKVIVLEKMPTYGGNSIINGGEYNAWDSELHLRQKLNLGDDSVALHTEDCCAAATGTGSRSWWA